MDDEEDDFDESDLEDMPHFYQQLSVEEQNKLFEILDDTLVNENEAVELESLIYEYIPHEAATIGLNEEGEEQSDADEDYGEDSEEEEGPDDEANIQLSDGDYFTAEMNGHGGLGESVYERVVPVKYADGGDPFMASMIENYALEGKNEDGTPNGKFFMNEATTKQAAIEVLKTHKKLEGKENEEYIKQYFDRTWQHFDVTHDNLVGAEVMPQFMRFLASDQALDL